MCHAGVRLFWPLVTFSKRSTSVAFSFQAEVGHVVSLCVCVCVVFACPVRIKSKSMRTPLPLLCRPIPGHLLSLICFVIPLPVCSQGFLCAHGLLLLLRRCLCSVSISFSLCVRVSAWCHAHAGLLHDGAGGTRWSCVGEDSLMQSSVCVRASEVWFVVTPETGGSSSARQEICINTS